MILESRTGKFFIVAAMAVILLSMGITNTILGRDMELGQDTDADSDIYQYHIAMIGSSPYGEFWTSVYEGANHTSHDHLRKSKRGIHSRKLGGIVACFECCKEIPGIPFL